MIDYKFKSDVLKLNIHKLVGKIDRIDFNYYSNGIIPEQDYDDIYTDLVLKYGMKVINECRKINLANYRRIERLKQRIIDYLKMGTCIFVTLTFDVDTLKNTSVETRRKYVSRYLKSISDYYVANIDYGKNTEREHYHALIVKDYIAQKWDYGFTWFERIHKTNSEVQIAKYISKLCNHAIKESTKRACYIYSRKKD